MMSGSGPTVFAIVEDSQKAKENAMIFAYEDDGVFYQEIKQGDINL